jgi:Icc-related predicted phosphoesterase
MKEFTFQLYSDLHLEYSKNIPKLIPLTKYLFLAGDIGKINTLTFKPFFDYCSSKWEKIFYCLGNHEFYDTNKNFDQLKEEYKLFFNQYQNIFLIEDSSVEFDNFVVLGNTLWSHPDDDTGLNDFKFINIIKKDISEKYKLSINHFQDLHKRSKEFIKEEIKKYNNKNIIILTHFPPTQKNTSHEKYKNQSKHYINYFASNFIDDFEEKNNIICWIYGHTHFSNVFDSSKNFKLVSNQLGYQDEINDVNFDEDGIFTVQCKY